MWISRKKYESLITENNSLKDNAIDAEKYRSIVGIMTRYDGAKDIEIRDVEWCIVGREFYDSLLKEMSKLRVDLQEACDMKSYYFNKYMEQKGRGEEKKQVTPWDVVKLLDQLREQNGECEVIIETPEKTVSVKLKDALIYEGHCGELVLDAK